MIHPVLKRLGLEEIQSGVSCGNWISNPSGPEIVSINPADGEPLARVRTAGLDDYEQVVIRAQTAFLKWRAIPAPARGQIVRELGTLSA